MGRSMLSLWTRWNSTGRMATIVRHLAVVTKVHGVWGRDLIRTTLISLISYWSLYHHPDLIRLTNSTSKTSVVLSLLLLSLRKSSQSAITSMLTTLLRKGKGLSGMESLRYLIKMILYCLMMWSGARSNITKEIALHLIRNILCRQNRNAWWFLEM